jgi:hypothetical protein
MGDAVRSVADLRFDWQGKTLMKQANALARHSRESGNPARNKARNAAQHLNCVPLRGDISTNRIPAFAGMTHVLFLGYLC